MADHHLSQLSSPQLRDIARAAHFLEMPRLLGEVCRLLGSVLVESELLPTLLLAHELCANRLRAACVRMGMQCVTQLTQPNSPQWCVVWTGCHPPLVPVLFWRSVRASSGVGTARVESSATHD
jgi:hypothetical protein